MQSTPLKLWLAEQPLVLASRSKARKVMLENAGIPVMVVPSHVNEPLLQKEYGSSATASQIAERLAEAKARNVSSKHPSRLVLGSDQTLGLDASTLVKAENRAQAKQRLVQLSGRQHQLYSAFCFMRDGKVLHSGVQRATINIRMLSEEFIEAYLDVSGSDVLASVAVYEIEALGMQIVEKIEGDWFTVQGLPLAEVIAFLHQQRLLLS